MKTVFYDINDGNIIYVLDGIQDLSAIDNSDNLGFIVIRKELLPPRQSSRYKVVNGDLVEKEIEPIKPSLPTEKELEQQAISTFSKLSFKIMAPTLQPTQVLQFEPLVENWQKGVYIIGDIRKHLGQVWKCVQGHNNTNNPDIEPGKSPAQWSPYHSKDIKYAKPYIQPQGAHDAYMKDEYMLFEDKTYKSIIDNNVWTPTGYPQGWLVI